jgi:hypothetical protein
MSSASCLHDFEEIINVRNSKATCNSQTGVRLGKLSVMHNTIWTFLDKLSDYKLLKDSAPHNAYTMIINHAMATYVRKNYRNFCGLAVHPSPTCTSVSLVDVPVQYSRGRSGGELQKKFFFKPSRTDGYL